MSKVCELTGIGVMSGHNVSHSRRRTKRKFLPNLRNISLHSDALNVNITLRVTSATLRTINKYGNLDSFLVNYNFNKLTDKGKKLKSKIKNALIKKGEYDNIKIVKEKKVVNRKTKKELKATKEPKEEKISKKETKAKEKKGE